MPVRDDKGGPVCLAIPRDLTALREILRGALRRLRSEHRGAIYRPDMDALPRCPAAVRGLIVFLAQARWIGRLQRLRRPVVNVSTRLPPTYFPSVVSDDRALGHMAAEHFSDRGYRRFAYLDVGEDLFFDRARLAAFSEALTRRGHSCEAVLPANTPPQQRAERIRHWLRRVPKPVAVLVAYDVPAVEFLGCCKAERIAVPGEVGVLSVGNDEVLCELSDPPLSSIDQNSLQLGYQAASLLVRLLEGEPAPQEPILIAPRGVVVRESSGATVSGSAELTPVLDFIWQHAGSLRGVEELCRHFPLSRRSLELLFEKHLGRSPAKEILRVRVEHAKARLAETDQTFKSVAAALGFRGLSHFVYVFHRQTGLTPSEYRGQNRLR